MSIFSYDIYIVGEKGSKIFLLPFCILHKTNIEQNVGIEMKYFEGIEYYINCIKKDKLSKTKKMCIQEIEYQLSELKKLL